MNMLKRIKEIEKIKPRLVGLDENHRGVIILSPADFNLLFKAFKAMRELLIEEIDEDAIGMKSLKGSTNFADQRFEERMEE